MRNFSLLLSLSLALLLLSRPALRLTYGQEVDGEEDLEGGFPEDAELEDDLYGGEEGSYGEEEASGEIPEGDDGDVKALDADSLAAMVEADKPFLLEFYAPWCGHCKALTPEFKAAAAVLKEHDVALAKIDATKFEQLAQDYGVEGYPSLFWIKGQVIKQYNGGRDRAEIVSWVKKRIGFAVVTLSTVDKAKEVLAENPALVAGFFKDLKGDEAAAFAESAKDADDIDYFQTDDVAVAKALGVATSKSATIAVVKESDDKFTEFAEGPYVAESISQFVRANRLPLFVSFSDETGQLIFGGSIKKMVFLFFPEEQYDAKVAEFAPLAREHKGQLIFIYVNSSDDAMQNVRDFFGVQAQDTLALGFSTQNREDGEKFGMPGELNTETLKTFAADVVAGTAKPFFKSAPKPETNDGPVTVVVGNSFEEIVLDETKDVLLEVYAPWCGHCKALEPTYKKLGEKFAGIPTVVIAKMDGTANEYPGVSIDGFPTLFFYPATNKSQPLVVDSERKLLDLAAYIGKHASIPFEAPDIKEEEQPEVDEEELAEEDEMFAEEDGGAEEEMKDEL